MEERVGEEGLTVAALMVIFMGDAIRLTEWADRIAYVTAFRWAGRGKVPGLHRSVSGRLFVEVADRAPVSDGRRKMRALLREMTAVLMRRERDGFRACARGLTGFGACACLRCGPPRAFVRDAAWERGRVFLADDATRGVAARVAGGPASFAGRVSPAGAQPSWWR